MDVHNFKITRNFTVRSPFKYCQFRAFNVFNKHGCLNQSKIDPYFGFLGSSQLAVLPKLPNSAIPVVSGGRFIGNCI